MILYCETSALVKLLVEEQGIDRMGEAFAADDGVAVCRISWAKTMAAFAQRSRNKGAKQEVFQQARQALQRAWPGFG